MLFFTVPFLLLFLVFPEQILEVIYGAQYSSGATCLRYRARISYPFDYAYASGGFGRDETGRD